MWSALRAVEETVLLLREAARRESENGTTERESVFASRFEQKAREAEARAELIRRAVLRHQALSLETVRGDAHSEEQGETRHDRENGRAAVASEPPTRAD